MLIEVLRHGLTRAGRYLVVRTRVDDRPGNLADLLALVAEERANVLGVDHHREGMDLPVTGTEIELTLVMRDEAHCEELLAQARRAGLHGRAAALASSRRSAASTGAEASGLATAARMAPGSALRACESVELRDCLSWHAHRTGGSAVLPR